MDKIAIALSACDDNAAAIEKLRARTAVNVADGTAADGHTDFGRISAGVVVVRFDGGSCTLEADGEAIATGGSPLIAVMARAGALSLNAEVSNARAAVFGRI